MTPEPGIGVEPRPPSGFDADRATWRSYWERLPERAIFRPEAADYVARLDAAVGLARGARVLDFGCGFGFVAEILARRVGEITLCDASEHMVRQARHRLAGHRHVRVADVRELGGQFDLILVNSVVQYMTRDELHGWLSRWRLLLAPGGRVVLSDLIVGDPHPWRELAEMLALAARGGVLVRTLRDGLSELAGYARARHARPLQRIEIGDLREHARGLGLAVELLPNLTYRSGRAAAVLSVTER